MLLPVAQFHLFHSAPGFCLTFHTMALFTLLSVSGTGNEANDFFLLRGNFLAFFFTFWMLVAQHGALKLLTF